LVSYRHAARTALILSSEGANLFNAFGWDGTCGAALQFLLAARHVNETILSGQGNNPVFIQWTVESPHWFTGQRPFTIRVGPNPTSWKGFSGKAW
jgi:hypothetical protein